MFKSMNWYALIWAIFLVGCNGGASLAPEGSSGGGDTGGSSENPYELSLSMVDDAGTATRNVSAASPGFLKARLLRDSSPAANELVSFITSAGDINPGLGVALTDSDGIATVVLLPGSEAGAGSVIASYQSPDGTLESSFNFNTAGDGESDTGAGGSLLTINLTNPNGDAASNVTADQPLTVSVTVLGTSGAPVTQRVVNFSSSLGSLTPVIGTALTDDTGTAVIRLNAGSVQGAGEITASYDGSSVSLGFTTAGDELDVDTGTSIEVSAQLYNCVGGVTPPDAACTETDNISQLEPGTLLINAVAEGTSTPITEALVTVTTTLGELSPTIGTAITDENGNAFVDIRAGSDIGAGEYTVTIKGESVTRAFQIGAVDENGIDIQVSDSLAGATLPAGSSTVIQVQVFQGDGVTPYAEPLNIELSSACGNAGTALIDSPVTTINGLGYSTYVAAGCVGTDPIYVTAATGGRSFSAAHQIEVAASAVGSIEFVSVSEDFIAIQQAGGLGRKTSSVVTFRLLDENSNPVPSAEIDFSLNTGNGGVSLDPVVGNTNADGYVSTTVTSGTVPTPVRITASYSDPASGEIVVSQVSDGINIGTGLADNNSFSLAVQTFNVEALGEDGVEVGVTAFAADHFNNPVPDGTTVQFTTEGGSIGPSCSTVNGACSVNWRSQNPRPLASGDPRFPEGFDFSNTIVDAGCGTGTFYGNGPCLLGEITETGTAVAGPQGGRSTILAYMVGEESFADINNNGLYDVGEFFIPLGDAFVDHNRNGVFDGNSTDAGNATDGMDLDGGELEEFFDNPIPAVQDGQYSAANSPAFYQGTLCSEAAQLAGHCAVKAVHARQKNVIIMSGSQAYFRVLEELSPLTDSDGELDVTTGPDSATIFISDILNNPMPAGSTVSVSVRDVVLLTDSSYTYPNTQSFWGFTLAVKAPDEPKGDGYVTVTVTTPGVNGGAGVVTQIGIAVNVVD